MAKLGAGKPLRLLELKGETWWFRRDVPADCRAVYGKKTWMQSLATSDARVAKERRDVVELETSEAFAAMRSGRWAAGSSLTPSHRGALWREVIGGLKTNPETEPEELALAAHAAEAEGGNLRGAAKAAFDNALMGRVAVDHHLEAYAKTISALAPATVSGRKGHIKQFTAWATANNLRLNGIDRNAAGRYVTATIDAMHPKTAEAHLSSLRSYWSFLHARGHVDGSDENGGPWQGQRIKAAGKRKNRGDDEDERPFTDDEARALLYSPFPAKMDSRHSAQVADILRISLLSGMRLEEIATLWVEEVHDGVFDIQQGKTEAAARQVPIHPDLKEIVERRTRGKGPKDWLFHELTKERDPRDVFGKRFRRYRLALGVDDKREAKRRSLVNFHSARHWFARQASFAGQTVEVIGSVIGHRPDKKKVTFGVYINATSEEQRLSCVLAVNLPGPL